MVNDMHVEVESLADHISESNEQTASKDSHSSTTKPDNIEEGKSQKYTDVLDGQLQQEKQPKEKASILECDVSSIVVNGHPIISSGMDISRFIVSDRDDGDPAITFRAVVLCTLFTTLASVIQTIYLFKPTGGGLDVSQAFLLVIIYVFGVAWARFTPDPANFRNAKVQAVLRFLNSGQKFGIKEHAITTMAAINSSQATAAIDIYAVERLYYNYTVTPTTAVLGTFSIATIGFCLAGIFRTITVYPSAMVYWGNLPLVVLYQRIHFDDIGHRMLHLSSFVKIFVASFLFEVFPAYIMPWLNGVSFVCLATTDANEGARRVITTLFGGASPNEGMGLFNFSLDWQYIQSISMSLPLKQQANVWAGLLMWVIIMPNLYYANVWNARDLPFMSTSLFGQDGKKFNAVKVFGTGVPILDVDKLKETGLPRVTASTAWGYFTSNMAIGALIVHVAIFYSRDMYRVVQHVRKGTLRDPHYEAMKRYKEVPIWWYALLFLLGFVAGLIVVTKEDSTTTLPVWGYLIALLLGCIIAPISCTLYALFGNSIATNQLSKMLAGALHPGRPLANMYFATWSHQVIALSVNLSQTLKMGQYIKISHRATFVMQLYGTLLGAAVNYLVMTTIVNKQRDILLDPIGDHVWSGAQLASLSSAAVTWSLAKQVYGYSGPYFIVPLGIVIGMALPVLHWLLLLPFPSLEELPIATPIIASYMGVYHYGNTSYVSSSILVGILTQVYLRRHRPEWYNKNNYLVGSALDGGSQALIFLLTFAVFGASGKRHDFPTWWGNPAGNPDHCL